MYCWYLSYISKTIFVQFSWLTSLRNFGLLNFFNCVLFIYNLHYLDSWSGWDRKVLLLSLSLSPFFQNHKSTIKTSFSVN